MKDEVLKGGRRGGYSSFRVVPVTIVLAGIVLGALFWQRSSVGAAPGSTTWEEPQLLSQATGDALSPLLRVAPNGTILVAYNWVTGTNQNPYFVESGDGGQNWSAPAPIRDSNSDLRQVTVAFDQNNVAHAVWRATGLGLVHADKPQWGSSGTTHTVVNAPEAIIQEPSLAIGPDGTLHLVWAQADSGIPHNIFHAFSTNNGATWSTPPTPLADHSQHSSVPAVAVGANNKVHVVWEETDLTSGLSYKIFYRSAAKNGSGYEWDTEHTVLSGDLTDAHRPAILADGTTVHVSFAEQENANADVQYPYYVEISDGAPSSPLDASGGNSVSVNIAPFFLITTLASCDNSVHVFYHGAAEENANEQIWGASSIGDWTIPEAATSDESRNLYPWLACTGNTLHLAFEQTQTTGGTHRIYYTTNRNIFRAHLPLVFRP